MKIGVIGCGVMGSAIAKHCAKEHSVILYDRNISKSKALAKEIGAEERETAADLIRDTDVIVLAIKPKDLAPLASESHKAFTRQKILISILTGATLAALKSYFPAPAIVRTMPNLGLVCGEGVIGLVEDPTLLPEVKMRIDVLFKGMGLHVWLPESKVEAITALSGSGIGFVMVMIEAMIDGGVFLGFSAAQAREIVLETFEGAIALMRATGKHPAELKLQISSPAGTTIAGLKAMEESGVRAGIVQTLAACYEKAQHMKTIT